MNYYIELNGDMESIHYPVDEDVYKAVKILLDEIVSLNALPVGD